jgi:hypothetical protein
MKVFKLLTFALVFVAGCSALPGLRVLTGEDTGPDAGVQNVEVIDLVMADKTGATDPSLMAAANRIEAASTNVDIIEIRKNDVDDALVVNLLFQPPADANFQSQAGLISYYTSIQRAIELTWQGTLGESEGAGLLQVNFIAPQDIATLDSGRSYIGFVMLNSQIERQAAIGYLSGTHNLNDFLDLIAGGTLLYEQPQTTQLYEGQPNHPLFMIGNPAVQGSS